ncbi:hypothetical protein H5410_049350 [Solanum commersonii]|uniref:Uncharacterized protein n=1 Tax=Solanum commersonii TaxID=4109 RepID=A0A9J5WS27_SOLCO|nr:hypothetical protein H5410_049350 [Solanum commersonii]
MPRSVKEMSFSRKSGAKRRRSFSRHWHYHITMRSIMADNRHLIVKAASLVGTLPTNYLGLPPDASNKDQRVCNLVLERVEKRLWGWKKSFSQRKVGRYPKKFSVYAADEAKKYHLVRWVTVTSLKKKWGGLGIEDLRVFNKAFLGKWLRRFRVEAISVDNLDTCGWG